MKEIWKDIPGLEGYYQASNKGRVRSVTRIITNSNGVKSTLNGRIMKFCINGHGYYHCAICVNGKRQTLKLHRILALCFIENPDNKPFINHIDANRLNNSLDNLEWCTPKENVDHMVRLGRHSKHGGNFLCQAGEENPSAKLTAKDVRQIRVLLTYRKQKDIASYYGVTAPTISSISRGLSWTHIK